MKAAPRIKPEAAIVAAICVVAALHCVQAVVRPFWMDEAITALEFASRPSLLGVYLSYDIPNNHILFTAVLKEWVSLLSLFGPVYDFSLRIPSLLFGIASAALICVAGMRVAGRPAGVAAAAFFIFSNSFLIYASALRGYMLGFLCILVALLLSMALLRRGGPLLYAAYFLACLLAVGTVPTDAIALGAISILHLPELLKGRKRFMRVLWLWISPPLALAVFYLPILPKFIRCLTLGEGWHSASGAAWDVYASFALAFLPLVPLAVGGAVSLWLSFPKMRWRLAAWACVFLVPLPFILLPATTPFPRVFIPLWAVWIPLLACCCGQAFKLVRRKAPKLHPAMLPLILFCAWTPLQLHNGGAILSAVFGDSSQDELFRPRYMEPGFKPNKIVERVAEMFKAGEASKVFVSFQADHYAAMLHGQFADLPEGVWLFDSPRRGKVQGRDFDAKALIVCAGKDDFEALKKRFGFKSATLLLDVGVQQLYKPEFE